MSDEKLQFNQHLSGANMNLSSNPNLDEEEGSGGALDFDKLLPILNKSLGWIILFILFSAASGYLYLRYTKPIYESASVLKLDVRNQENMSNWLMANIVDKDISSSVLAGEIELIKSMIIYEKVLDKIDLSITYTQRGKFLQTEMYKSSPFRVRAEVINPVIFDVPIDVEIIDDKEYILTYKLGNESANSRFQFGKAYENQHLRFTLEKTDHFKKDAPEFRYIFTLNSKGALNRYLETNLTAKVLNASANTIQVSFTDYAPEKARDIVNTIDTVYLVETLRKKSQVAEQTLSFLDDQLDSTAKKLEMSEAEVEAFIKRNKALDIKTKFGTTGKFIEELMEQKLDLSLQQSYLKDLENLVVQNKEISQLLPLLKFIKDPELSSLATKLNDELQERDKILITTKESSLASKMSRLKSDRMKADLLELVEANKDFIAQQLRNTTEKIKKAEAELLSMPNQDTDLTRIRRWYNLNEKFYLMLIERKAEFGILKAGTVPDFQILQVASLPKVPVSPQKGNVYALWIVIGLVAGVVLVVVRYILQDTVVTMKEIEKLVPAPLLGVVPVYTKEKLRVAKLVVDKNPKSSLSESLRAIRTNIDFLTSGKERKKILSVTSTVASEGKTFIAINLSGILALSGYKVVILDLDMRKPKLHLGFDLVNDKGMSTILIGRNTWQECISPTSIENISVITAGPTPPNPSELLLRKSLDDLFVELHEHFDIILVDSPPVGLVTDGIIIMQKVDLPIYVVRSEYSKRIYLKNITKLVRVNGFRNLSVILNGLDKFKTYGYGYGYGYDYYTDDDVPTGFDMSWMKNLIGLKN